MSIPGNSFIGVVLLWLVHGGSLVHSYRVGTDIPHWVLVSGDGTVRHFAPTQDLFDPPLSHVLYLGRFEAVEN
jgi:hypothetical protein